MIWAKQQLCTCITLFSTFLWHPLHFHDATLPNATFYGGREHKTRSFSFSFWTWLQISSWKIRRPNFQWQINWESWINSIKFRITQIHFFIDSFLTCHHRRGCLTLWTLGLQYEVQVLPWPLARFVHGSPKFKSSTLLVNSQLVCPRPVGILKPV